MQGGREERCALRSQQSVRIRILPTLGGTPMVWNTRLRGTEVMDLVEAEAARDDWFKSAFGKIWIVAKGLPPDVVERIVIASGDAIRPA